MAKEIERKFLLRNDNWREHSGAGVKYVQGYLLGAEQASVRVRIQGEAAFINIKSATLGIERLEFEYAIPLVDAEQILEQLCEKPLICKTRYKIPQGELCWEIDEFVGENQGLIVAEIELQDADQDFPKPDWLGEEVSDDTRYYNVCLVKHPYSQW